MQEGVIIEKECHTFKYKESGGTEN